MITAKGFFQYKCNLCSFLLPNLMPVFTGQRKIMVLVSLSDLLSKIPCPSIFNKHINDINAEKLCFLTEFIVCECVMNVSGINSTMSLGLHTILFYWMFFHIA